MKTPKILFLFCFTILACQQTHAFLFKDTSKLWSKLLKFDAGSAEAPSQPVSKEENFFTVLKDTKEKFFKEIPKTVKNFIHKFEDKFEKKVDKIEKEKEDFDEKILKFFENKKHVKNIFKELIEEKIDKIEDEFVDKKVIKKPAVKDPYAKPAPKVYKPKEKIIKVLPKYAPKSAEVVEPSSEEVYVKPKPYVPPKYLPKSAKVEEPSSEEAYVKPKPYAAPLPKPAEAYPCSEEYIPEPRLVRLKATVPENIYYFT